MKMGILVLKCLEFTETACKNAIITSNNGPVKCSELVYYAQPAGASKVAYFPRFFELMI